MNRVLPLLLALTLLSSLAACRGEAPAPSPPGPSAPVESAAPAPSPAPSAEPSAPPSAEPSAPPSFDPSPFPASEPAPGLSALDPDAFQRVPYVDPEEYDMTPYSTAAILSAWEGRDPSGLSEYDRAIYDAAARVLEDVLTDGMTDYEKEYALYQWLTSQVAYDWDHQDPLAEESRDSFTPYGALVNRKAICLGFASAFQLLLDMAGVECITVVGAAARSTRDHAWNMVRLNGEWYCVDPTWDSNSHGRILDYFNVTSDAMAMSGHQWDYDSVPEAVAEDGGLPGGASGRPPEG